MSFRRLLIIVLAKSTLFLLFFASSLPVHNECRPLSCAADKYADGCSVPLMVPAPFKAEFTRACNRHDICYGCGHHYNWSRSDCDKAFYKNMRITCEHLRARRTLLESILNFWNELGSKKTQCLTSAKLYYEGVHLFAESHYDRKDHDYCLSKCSNSHGNPRYNVTVW